KSRDAATRRSPVPSRSPYSPVRARRASRSGKGRHAAPPISPGSVTISKYGPNRATSPRISATSAGTAARVMPSSVQGGAAVSGGGPPRDGSTKRVTARATKWVRPSVRRAAVVAAVQGGLQGAGRLFLRVVGGHAGSVLVHDGSLRSLSWCVWAAGEPWFARSGTDIGLPARQRLRSGSRPAGAAAPPR